MDKDSKTISPEASSTVVVCPYSAGGGPGALRDDDTSLDVVAVVKVMSSRWKTLASILFVFLVMGTIYAKLQPNVYRAEALLIPSKQYSATPKSGGLSDSFKGLAPIMGLSMSSPDSEIDMNYVLAVMGTKPFLAKAIEEMELLPLLVDTSKMNPVPDDKKKLELAVDKLESAFYLKKEKLNSTLFLFGISDKSPGVSLILTKKMIEAINNYMRHDTVQNATKEIAFLTMQAEKVSVPEMKVVLYGLISEKKKQIVLAEARPDYMFRIVNPPEMPARPIAPRRVVILVAFFLMGAVVAIPIVLLLEVRQNGWAHLIK